ncbi:PREDICTED: probable F-box protein At5g47300 [Erythranthe guttata]|uniref:probable F-box protein At5g47300 n=1 Tax=Erythranthe guttata TaxID=4155 RepID=UPI00064D91DE|nr:PREDICTED: probable F-box protein At5g47300 [Erythranthe guttata]|eukprot:XP_012843128.1 PREDICTED: probable F-box protein At5g47300 [Erythranthe guttata]
MHKHAANISTPPTDSKTMADNKSHLPPEIIEIILSKLSSVKSLLRFKSVSKSWNTIITDPVFVQNHIQKSKESNSQNLFLCRVRSSSPIRFSVVEFDDDEKFQTLPVVIEAPFGCGLVLCFCDGILLLTNRACMKFVLWNPSTRTAEKLWHRNCCRKAAFGLCRDPNTDDFKVVVADWYDYSVYSCKNKSWIAMKREYEVEYTGLGLNPMKNNTPKGVCVDGATYWFWSDMYVTKIVYYDPRDDKFKILGKPENLGESKIVYLVNFRGSLCLYCNLFGKFKFRIWTKENGIDNNSWKELITVEYNMSNSSLFQLCSVGNKILFRVTDDELIIYNPCEKRLEESEDYKLLFRGGVVPVPYMESMYFPIEKPNRKWKRKRSIDI